MSGDFEDELTKLVQQAPPPPLERWRTARVIAPLRLVWYRRVATVVPLIALLLMGTVALTVGLVASHSHGGGAPTATRSPLPHQTAGVATSASASPASTTHPATARPGPTPTRRPAHTAAPVHAVPPSKSVWHPATTTEWQYEIDHPLNPNNAVDMGTSTGTGPVTTYSGATAPQPQAYVIDGFENGYDPQHNIVDKNGVPVSNNPSSNVVATLHADGKRAVCYIEMGIDDPSRPDAYKFPSSVVSSSGPGGGSRWLDIRQISTLAPILKARIQMCHAKGFDALEPDNLDNYTDHTGFPLTAQDQITFNEWVANTAHAAGMSVALGGDIDQAPSLAGAFDFAIGEQCFQSHDCQPLATSFAAHGKAVFDIEYSSTSGFCSQANSMNFNAMSEPTSLNGKRSPCR